jgi:DNA-binding transcriptional ArsR family regulator
MALRSLDAKRGQTPPATYFGGQARLLGDLGQMPTRTAIRHLRAHLRTLRDAGLVSVAERSGPGRRAVYELHLPVDNLPP